MARDAGEGLLASAALAALDEAGDGLRPVATVIRPLMGIPKEIDVPRVLRAYHDLWPDPLAR